MPDGQHLSHFQDEDGAVASYSGYTPPLSLILQGLGITEIDMQRPHVSVSAQFLRFMICEYARSLPFDADQYAQANPDVEAARLAGDVSTLHEHFVTQGYFERRQPHELPFDAFYYATHYEDLARAFDPNDVTALRRHYNSHGWQEGRVGVSWQRADADRWVTAARAGQGEV
jgi:hypothetical protein